MTQNPLLAPVSDLVDYAAVTPAHIVPAVEELLGIARQAVEHAADPSLPATWEAVAEPLDTASERLWRLVGGGPPERRGQHARAARGLQRRAAAGHRILHLGRPARGPVQAIPAPGRRAGLRRLDAGAPPHRRDGAARLPAERRRAAGRRPRALRRHFRPRGPGLAEVLRERAGRHRRLVAVRRGRSAPGRHPGRRAGRRPRRRRGRRQAGLEADAENALLPAGDAVRPRPRPARGAVPRLWHRRVGTG